MRVVVKDNIKSVRKAMTAAQRKELPTAIRNSLNDTAFDVRKFAGTTLWNRSFPNRRNSKFGQTLFRVEKANKKNLRSKVFTQLKRDVGYGNDLVKRVVTGETRRASRGSNLAIPSENVRRGTRGVVKSQRPGQLKNAVVRKGRTGRDLIFQQTRGGLKFMYTLAASASQQKHFPFYKFAGAKARMRFPKHLEREQKFAIARAERHIKRP